MSTTRELRTSHPHEATWDNHGGYQWEYFGPTVKPRISYFLQERLFGRNIDIGGGWYLHYPNSTVVDLSSVCLENNPAQDKLQFDLDELATGKKLPYPDHSFDSATMISSWQYLKNPDALVEELKRILIPGGEVYIINGQGAGLQPCKVSSGKSEDVRDFFKSRVFDTLIEVIPTSDGNVTQFQSVCVAMPEKNIFGETISKIKGKERRRRAAYTVRKDPKLFNDAYKNSELKKSCELLSQLKMYPITEFSQQFVANIEAFSQEFAAIFGVIPLMFSELALDPQVLMVTPDSQKPMLTTVYLGDRSAFKEGDPQGIPNIFMKYGLRQSIYHGYFPHEHGGEDETIERILDFCRKFRVQPTRVFDGDGKKNERDLHKFTEFIAAFPLNSFTSQLQKDVYEALKPNISNLDERIMDHIADNYSMAVSSHKNKRRISEMIAQKKKVETLGVPITGYRTLDYVPYIPRILRHA